MFKRIRIRKHEIGLWFRRGDFERPLGPGIHWIYLGIFNWLLSRTARSHVDVVNTLVPQFDHILLDVMLENTELREQLTLVDLTDMQRAIVWMDGRLLEILRPGRYTYWKRPRDITVEVFDIDAEAAFDHPKREAILNFPGSAQVFEAVRVEAHQRFLMFREGELVRELGPGLHVFWRNAAKFTFQPIDLREQITDVAGQEIMTADKVTLRINLALTYRVTDPVTAVTSVEDYAQALYREAQLVLREAVGGRTLDKLLADKDSVSREVREALAPRVEQFGVSVRAAGLRDIILPGEMKMILNQVIEAQKQAEANLIRRREETAAARSQANTAKLLADNPALQRMKELEHLQDILRGANATFVLGHEPLTEQVGRLITSPTTASTDA